MSDFLKYLENMRTQLGFDTKSRKLKLQIRIEESHPLYQQKSAQSYNSKRFFISLMFNVLH